MHKTIDGNLLKEMFICGTERLIAKRDMVNDLNVYPVPDGDTGTNMSLTMESAVKKLRGLQNPTVDDVAEAITLGTLMGARGNSGVILSQLWRGFAKPCKGKKELAVADFSAALEEGVRVAYKAIMKPVEGTILTVARCAAEAGMKEKKAESVETFMEAVIKAADIALQKTPEQLPVLKQAGVVDAGGQGLICIYEGMLNRLNGKAQVGSVAATAAAPAPKETGVRSTHDTNVEFAYCTELLIESSKPNAVKELQETLSKLGDSLIVVGDESFVKVHVHSNTPDKVLAAGLKQGTLKQVKVENMVDQHEHLINEEAEVAAAAAPEKKAPTHALGVLAVVNGEGLEAIFQSFGASTSVRGGQTMNPSTEDLAKGVDAIDAESVIILPNNKNIIMAAEQVKAVSEKNVYVVPTRSIPQGIAAMMEFAPDADGKATAEAMAESLSLVKSGQITRAVRDAAVDGAQVKKDEFMGLKEGKIAAHSTSLHDTILDLLTAMVDEDSELVTAYFGETITEQQAMAHRDAIEEKFPSLEVEFHAGGQPVYDYLISVE